MEWTHPITTLKDKSYLLANKGKQWIFIKVITKLVSVYFPQKVDLRTAINEKSNLFQEIIFSFYFFSQEFWVLILFF